MTLNKRHPTLFLKKLRKITAKAAQTKEGGTTDALKAAVAKNAEKLTNKYTPPETIQKQKQKNTIKYYLAGEYGEKFMRPHYHLIIFNTDFDSIQKAWPYGHIDCGPLNIRTVQYTLGYINKNYRIPMHQRDDRVPEYSTMSKKLGANYITDKSRSWHMADLENRYYLPVEDGKKIALPRYYKEKLFTQRQREVVGKILIDKQIEEASKKELSTHLEEIQKKNALRERSVEKNSINRRQKL